MSIRNVVIALMMAVCLFIYLFFRMETIIVNNLAIWVLSLENYSAARLWVNNVVQLPDVMVYSLPEGLWIFCLTLMARNVKFEVTKRVIDCSVFPLIYALLLEVLQLLELTNGTFDFMDLIFATSFWLLARNIKTPQLHQLPLSFYNTRSKVLLFSFSLILLSDVWS